MAKKKDGTERSFGEALRERYNKIAHRNFCALEYRKAHPELKMSRKAAKRYVNEHLLFGYLKGVEAELRAARGR